ncbi:serine/threonine-protein kinase [Nocardia yamanashiensis]|uniref:serine/threonine-protein kinase n=1 Tax=Nocardia yamanashiensis TaxID=209247 RepID=UPI0022B81C5B|nr:serine/threonine-protein kinase [Nocardia yamanashiensis]
MNEQRRTLTVGSQFGPYRLDRLIGRGGMGEVYQAYDTVKDRVVAIKVLPERLAQDPLYRQRFQRESHAAARLRQVHVIPIHDYGEIDGRLYIDMRLVEGDNLRDQLERVGPLTPERAVTLIEQLAAALDAAHADGLMHRDVKPDNILLTRDGFTYLVDFGIAQSATDTSLTTDGAAVGSFRYMAPERFSSHDYTPAADVYALACVLFECLTGSRPYPGDTNVHLMRAHLFDPIPHASGVRPGVPPAFDAVLERGLAKEPRDRYASAGDLATAARAALGGRTEPVANKPVPASKPRFARRARRAATLLTVLLLVIASAGFAGWAKWQQSAPGTALADDSALSVADLELLPMVSEYSYRRSRCYHTQPPATVVSMFWCSAHAATNAPLGQFWRFRSIEALQSVYATAVLGTMQATACPDQPAGKDGPLTVKGKVVGRQACFVDRSLHPDAPQPALAVTDESLLTMAVYTYAKPANTALRDYVAKYNYAQFVAADERHDPDSFEPADIDLLARTGKYTRSTCAHTEAVVSPLVNALVACGAPAGGPSLVAVFGVESARSAGLFYDSNLSQLPGHACDGSSAKDTEWRKSGTALGRLFCANNNAFENGARPCLHAMHTDQRLVYVICAHQHDYPEAGPKTDAELLAWFRTNFQ